HERSTLCCAVGVTAVATGAIGWRRFRRFLPPLPGPQSFLDAGPAASVVITALSLEHVSHHAAYSGPELTGIPCLFVAVAIARRTWQATRSRSWLPPPQQPIRRPSTN